MGLLLGWASLSPGLGYRAESLVLDHWFEARYSIFGPEPMDPRLVLVGIDADTIESLGKPMLFWQSDLAKLIDQIKSGEPAAVGLDLIISPKTKNLPEEVDEQLQDEALELGYSAKTGPVVLAEIYETSEYTLSETGGQGYEDAPVVSPHECARDQLVNVDASSPKLGLVNVLLDSDGSVRRCLVFPPLERKGEAQQALPDQVRPSNFALKLLEIATGTPVEYSRPGLPTRSLRWGQVEVPLFGQDTFLINFPGPTEDSVPRGQAPPPSQSFPILSAAKVLDGTIAPSEFKDKIVILGPTANSLKDIHSVPGDSEYKGPAIHLSVLNSFLKNRFLKRHDNFWLLSCALLTVLGAAVGRSGRVTTLPIGLAALAGISFFGFATQAIWFPTIFWSLSFGVGGFLGYLQRMLTVERDRAIVRSTFARMVSPQVMEHVLDDISSLYRGRRKDLTVLFTDINDFTPICEKHEPEEVITMLSDYFSLMVDVIMKYDGYLKQYVGDEIMVIFGAPDDSQDHATRALMTALEMRDVLAKAKEEAGDKPGFYEVKIGINSGSVVVGKVGPEKRWEYAAVGDSVNLGARVMSTAQKLGMDIGVSDATRRRYLEELAQSPSNGDPIAWNSVGVQQFKGKVSQMEVFGINRKEDS